MQRHRSAAGSSGCLLCARLHQVKAQAAQLAGSRCSPPPPLRTPPLQGLRSLHLSCGWHDALEPTALSPLTALTSLAVWQPRHGLSISSLLTPLTQLRRLVVRRDPKDTRLEITLIAASALTALTSLECGGRAGPLGGGGLFDFAGAPLPVAAAPPLVALAALTGLRRLALPGVSFCQDGVAALAAACPGLTHLRVASLAADRELPHVTLPSLHTLACGFRHRFEYGIRRLAPALRRLEVGGCPDGLPLEDGLSLDTIVLTGEQRHLASQACAACQGPFALLRCPAACAVGEENALLCLAHLCSLAWFFPAH